MKAKNILSIIFAITGLLLLPGCGQKAAPESSAAQTAGEDAAKRYPLRGVVVEVDAAKKSLLVQHEDIPGFMPAMTMPFPVDAAVIETVKPGQTITATLVHANAGFWLEDVKAVAAASME